MNTEITHADHEQAALRREKLRALQAAGKCPFAHNSFAVDATSADVADDFDARCGTTVTIAGRMMTRRMMGRAAFFHLQDARGRVQAYIKRDAVGDATFEAFKQMDLGDIVGITGEVFKTQAGEPSVRIAEITLLAKSLNVPPEKFHGLRDTETKYRKRYLDLIANRASMDIFLLRSKILSHVRKFLDAQGFLEVTTPILTSVASGGAARPFATHHNALDMDMFLRVALELPLKRLIIGGFDKVYEMGACFRNEGLSTRHNPEFTMLELYQAYTDLGGMMQLVQNLIGFLCENVLGTYEITYAGHDVSLAAPFAAMTMAQAVLAHSGVDFAQITDTAAARAAADAHSVQYQPHHTTGNILLAFFDAFAEDKLVQPTFITEYPIEISPLAKRIPGKPGLTERFELFIAGREVANAFSELNNPIEQRERFVAQAAARKADDADAMAPDMDFVEAMEYGMPPTGGIGIGMDRLIMLLTGAVSIRDILFFPAMKPE